MPLNNEESARAIAALEKRLDKAELTTELALQIVEQRFAEQHRAVLELLQRVYPAGTTIGAAVKRLLEGMT